MKVLDISPYYLEKMVLTMGSTLDRYRIVVPMKESFTANKTEYRASMTQLADKLGLTQYTNKKALTDMARYYYKSPANAEVFINNTQQAYDVQPIKEAVKREIAEKQRLQKESMAQGMKALNRENKGLQLQIMHDSADYHTMIDVNAMNKLPLDQVYQNLTGHEIKEQGSYKMAKGFEPGTSSSRDTLAFIENEDGTQLAHDLKTGNTHNAISMLKEMKGLNVYQSAEFLEKEYRVNLKQPNPVYYQKMIGKALSQSTNDKTFKENLKEISGARNIKLDMNKEQINIADKQFSFDQLGIKKDNMIQKLRENRAEKKPIRDHGYSMER